MNNEKALLWEQRINECRNSNLTVNAWCEQNHISQATYYYWHKRIIHKQETVCETPVLAEITPFLLKQNSDITSNLKITLNHLSIEIKNSDEAELAAVFINKLQQLC